LAPRLSQHWKKLGGLFFEKKLTCTPMELLWAILTQSCVIVSISKNYIKDIGVW
jgi:hypothetical protein